MTRRIMTWSAVFLGLALCLVLVNQVLQLAAFASAISPTLGNGVLWGLTLLLGLGLSVPVLMVLRLPPRLVAPSTDHGPEFDEHLRRLRRRLRSNSITRGRPLESREDVEAALFALDEAAADLVKVAGSRAFMTTAISQNGALDALVVFGIQTRLVWDVAGVYSQRPGLRELSYLYSNVLTTAFIAGELDEADMAEAMEPAVSAVLGSAAGLVPGLQVASNIFVSSVLTGTANAFMTLRTGVIAQEYSRAWTHLPRGKLRNLAVAKASGMLGEIVLSGATRVSVALGRGAKRAVTGTITSTGRAMKDAVTGTGRAVSGAVSGTGKKLAATGSAIRGRLRHESSEDDEPQADMTDTGRSPDPL